MIGVLDIKLHVFGEFDIPNSDHPLWIVRRPRLLPEKPSAGPRGGPFPGNVPREGPATSFSGKRPGRTGRDGLFQERAGEDGLGPGFSGKRPRTTGVDGAFRERAA